MAVRGYQSESLKNRVSRPLAHTFWGPKRGCWRGGVGVVYRPPAGGRGAQGVLEWIPPKARAQILRGGMPAALGPRLQPREGDRPANGELGELDKLAGVPWSRSAVRHHPPRCPPSPIWWRWPPPSLRNLASPLPCATTPSQTCGNRTGHRRRHRHQAYAHRGERLVLAQRVRERAG